MESALLGVVLDSSILIAAERRRLTPAEAVRNARGIVGEIPIALCSISIAEIGHGIYRATDSHVRDRRRAFLNELKATVPIYPMTVSTAELMARLGGEQAAKGINLPITDLIIGACALELGYAVATHNVRDFARIPGLVVVRI